MKKKLLLTLACLASLSAVYASDTKGINLTTTTQQTVADSVDLAQYVGKYKFTGLPFEFITISVKDGKLNINTGSEEGPMTPVKDAADTFDADGRATLKFTRDDQKKVNGITLEAQGMSFEGKKDA